jgi:hypothetical protein
VPLPDGTVTLGDILSDQYAGTIWTIQTTADDVADYASLQWDVSNGVTKPSLATLQGLRATTTANLVAAAKAFRVAAALEAQQDQIAKALGILADGLDQLNNALKVTSFTAGSRPVITSLAGLRTKIQQVLATP